jgi:1,4-dihydroxy-2-naphthoyl-CoA hydrolase
VALAETVVSLAANFTLDPARQIAVGLDINANHVGPVKQGFVIATAHPETLGRTTQEWSIRIVDEQDRLGRILGLASDQRLAGAVRLTVHEVP